MTTTTHQPTLRPHGRTVTHRALAAVVALVVLAHAAGAAWAAWETHHATVTARPDQDISLYGVGYVVAVLLGGVALVGAVGGAVGWFVARRRPEAGTAVLALTAALTLAPVVWWLGLPGSL